MRKITILLTCLLLPLFLAGQVSDKTAELFEAVQNGELAKLQSLIQAPSDLGVKNQQKRTLLHEAAYNGKKEIVDFLLSKGLSVDSQDFSGWQPLHDAVFKNHLSVAASLLEKGANINAQNNKGQTPLSLAVEQKLTEMIKFLLTKNASLSTGDLNGLTVLHLSATQGSIEYLQLFLSAGANVNVKDSRGRTPLFDAVQSGHLEAVKLLIEKGADLNIQDYSINNPRRPVDLALSPEIVQLLKDKGAIPAKPFFIDAFAVTPSFRYAHVIDNHDITYGGLQLEWFLTSNFSLYWSYYMGKGVDDSDTYYHMPGMGVLLHSFFTLFSYNYDKEINGKEWHIMAAMIISGLLPEGFTYHYWVEHYFDLGIFVSLTNLDIRKKSAEDNEVYIGGEIGLRYTFYPYKTWTIAPFTSVEILFDEGDTGFNAGLNISYTF